MRRVPYIYGIQKSVGANSKDTLVIQIQEGDFLISDFAAYSPGAFEVTSLSGSGDDQDMIKGDNIHKDVLFGLAGKPLYLPRAWKLKTKNSLMTDVLDISGAANIISLAFSGHRLSQGQERAPAKYEVPKMLAGKVSLAANGDGEIQLITGPYDFALIGMIHDSTGLFDVINITDDSTDRELLNSRLTCDAVFGTVEFPRFLPGRRIYPAKTKIRIPCTDISGLPNDAYVNFVGVNLIGKI